MNTAIDGHLPRMQEMLIGAHVQAVMSVLQALGENTYTVQDVTEAVVTVAQNGGGTLDDFITLQVEKVEKDRRLGLIPGLIMNGDVPQVG
jgi:hypothetical protein